ncbi:MAG: DUF4365 domain-containing protein [Flavobacteriales bacterium]|nr:DUF4365 domain-containing protein [Flavobacteriales bacterium]
MSQSLTMNARFNATEHIGLYEVGLIFLRDIGWIYRQQPSADVGMDALVEEAVGSNPTGRFLMVQVKSGEGNVRVTKNEFVYSMSGVHYEYYLQVEMPVILVLYSPSKKIAWWNVVNRTTVVRAGAGWKLRINKLRQLNSTSLDELTTILEEFATGRRTARTTDYPERSVEELSADAGQIGECTEPLSEIVNAQREFSQSIRIITSNFALYNNRRLNINSPEIRNALSKTNRQLLKFANRITKNSRNFSTHFTKSVSAVEVIILLFGDRPEIWTQYPILLPAMKRLRDSLDKSIPEAEGLLHALEALDTKFNQLLTGRLRSIAAIDALISDLRDSRSLIMKSVLLVESKLIVPTGYLPHDPEV